MFRATMCPSSGETTVFMMRYMTYFLTSMGSQPVAVVQYSTVHIYTHTHAHTHTHTHTHNTQNDTKQAIHRTTQTLWESAGRVPSLRVTPWHLPYN